MLSTYRQLLREIRTQYTKVANHASFEQDLKAAFRDSRQNTDEARLADLKENAENILLFLKSTRQHKELLERYNPALMEQSKRIELSAHRVGLNLPKQYDPANPGSLEFPRMQPQEAAVQERVGKAFGNVAPDNTNAKIY
ncbi:hypothetical protein BGW37DRAFT_498629 [Umbelopsis sp. PMI_123]|nr:hypothetical protein BGW37DRAFT_498629 [Umbelopsis sp. PMI_123]